MDDQMDDASTDRYDAWGNVLTGLGLAGIDPRMSAQIGDPSQVSYDEADAIWRGDWMAAKIIERLTDDMLRAGFRPVCQAATADLSEEMSSEIVRSWEKLGLVDLLSKVHNFSRAYGGGGIYLGTVDSSAGDLSKPLIVDSVTRVDFANALTLRELAVEEMYNDPLARHYGAHEMYRVNSVGRSSAVHASRVISISGPVTSAQARVSCQGWGDSVFTRVREAIADVHAAAQAAGVLVQDFAQAVYTNESLGHLVKTNDYSALKKRAQALMMSRSVARAIMLGAGETYERMATPVSGIDTILEILKTNVAAAADYPKTLLYGESPGGLNATGKSDITLYYDRVSARQQMVFESVIRRFTDVIIAAHRLPIDAYSIEFGSLWQPSAKEIADTRAVTATTDATYIDRGVVSPEEVRLSRYGGAEYSADTAIDVASGLGDPGNVDGGTLTIERRGDDYLLVDGSGHIVASGTDYADLIAAAAAAG